jgi:RNA recognition motif-containing protein
VFVSGLAFDMKKKDVEELFRECGKITSCKLLTFEDTGRCKGQAFITFETDASAKKAIQLSGTTIKNDEQKKKKSKKGDSKEEASKRKELGLKVTRRLSRAVTKGKTAS